MTSKSTVTKEKAELAEEKTINMAKWLEEKHAAQVLALDVQAVCSVAESLIVVSASNVRHAQALADWLRKKGKENKIEFLGMEGYTPGYWILMDFNDVIVHIFQEEYRNFYNIEGLWGEVPIIYSS